MIVPDLEFGLAGVQNENVSTGALGSKTNQNLRADVPATPEQMFNPLVHT